MPYRVSLKDKPNPPTMRARELGKADGLSQSYRWDASNQHSVEMDDRDAAFLRDEHPNKGAFRFEEVAAEPDADATETDAGARGRGGAR